MVYMIIALDLKSKIPVLKGNGLDTGNFFVYNAYIGYAYRQYVKEAVNIKYQSEEYWNGLIRMSLSRFFMLRVLCCRSLHGYEIAKEVAALTGGCCAPTEGSLYPVLHEFEQNGLVTSQTQVVGNRERKVYTLTEKGLQAYQTAAGAWVKAARYILKEVNCHNFDQVRTEEE